MLNSISWSQFFTAMVLIAGGYYLISVFLLYSAEIKTFLKGKPSQQENETNDTSLHHDVLGTTRETIKPHQRAEYVSSESLRFAGPNEPDDPIDGKKEQSDEDMLTGSVADLLEEIKLKVSSLKDWNKDECLPAFHELLHRYPQLRDTVYQESIAYFIAKICSEHFTWTVEPEEVNALWT